MRKLSRVAVLAGVLGLAACSGDELTRTFGLTRDAPDEFQVTTRAPLSMPPNFRQLPMPQPGVQRPQEMTQEQQAEAALVPDSVMQGSQSGPNSAGQQALVQASGPEPPRNIRTLVNSESSLDTPSRSFADRLMFWQPAPLPGTVVDPARESQRLRQNAALGQSNENGDTPIIQRRRPGIFNIF